MLNPQGTPEIQPKLPARCSGSSNPGVEGWRGREGGRSKHSHVFVQLGITPEPSHGESMVQTLAQTQTTARTDGGVLQGQLVFTLEANTA